MKRIILLITLLLSLIFISVMVASASDGALNGGGHILEAPDGLKRPYWLDISFGGWLQGDGQDVTGEWQINFHNVGADWLDQGNFHTTDIRVVNWFDPRAGETTCTAAFNFTAFGTLNGVPNHKVIFRGGDYSTPNDGYADTIRVELYNESGVKIYDTHAVDEFTDESSCVGGARTSLDNGNITIVYPMP